MVHRVGAPLLVVFALLGLSACGHVEPWEKEDMATLDEHERMESSGSEYEAHLWSVREAAVGGTGQAGGGCGCN